MSPPVGATIVAADAPETTPLGASRHQFGKFKRKYLALPTAVRTRFALGAHAPDLTPHAVGCSDAFGDVSVVKARVSVCADGDIDVVGRPTCFHRDDVRTSRWCRAPSGQGGLFGAVEHPPTGWRFDCCSAHPRTLTEAYRTSSANRSTRQAGSAVAPAAIVSTATNRGGAVCKKDSCGIRSATGVPLRVTVNDSPRSTRRMISPPSFPQLPLADERIHVNQSSDRRYG